MDITQEPRFTGINISTQGPASRFYNRELSNRMDKTHEPRFTGKNAKLNSIK